MNAARISAAERHAVAAHSSDLRVRESGSDADVLVAAGMIAASVKTVAETINGRVVTNEVIDWEKRKRVTLALQIWRYGVTGDRANLWPIVAACDDWLIAHLKRKNRKIPPQSTRRALVVSVLTWFANQGCDFCSGTGVLAADGTAGKLTEPCSACHGSGKKSLERSVPRALIEQARWIETQINQHVAMVHRAMAEKLSGKIKEAGL